MVKTLTKQNRLYESQGDKMKTSYSFTPKIYVACLASYNNGILYGEWIDATLDSEEITQQVQEMLKKSPSEGAEEWAIHDTEDFGSFDISEWQDFETVSKIANALQEHGEILSLAYEDVHDLDEAIDMVENRYQGCFESKEDFAYQFCQDIYGEAPDWCKNHINYDAIARDWELSGDYIFISESFDQIHVFSSC